MKRYMQVLAIWLLPLAAMCEAPPQGDVPDGETVAGYYDTSGGLTVSVLGNVATVSIQQDPQQIRRGGALWAKVGPYIFLFSEETKLLFEEHPALAGVRVRTMVGDAEVASALLARDALSDVLWARGMNIAGRARRDGSRQVTLLEDLVDWGESHSEFEYNSRFTRR